MLEADVERLRDAGLDDRAIVDANQVVAYFNYVNRIADGLGVDLEGEWPDELRTRSAGWNAVAADALEWVDADQMRRLDRVAEEQFGLTLVQMMENAGRHLAEVARRALGGRVDRRRLVVLSGAGGNGGGGLVAARHLANAGARVEILLSHGIDRLAPATMAQQRIVRAMDLPLSAEGSIDGEVDLVLDALLGYSQSGAPSGRTGELVTATTRRPVVALDVPSGLELASGRLHEPHVRAQATLTLAAPKIALRGARAAVGSLYLGDVGIPSAAYDRVGLRRPDRFASSSLLRIADEAEHS